jgi:ankyrin repeat protein
MASDANERLRDAAGLGDVAGIAAALLAGADPNAPLSGRTPLHRAAHYGHVAAIAALLAAGARMDGADSYGTTPLMEAAQNDRTAAIDALLAAGVHVNRATPSGHTALHYAGMWSRLDTARVLLEAGARTDVRNRDGKRPIDVVCANDVAWRTRRFVAMRSPCAQVLGHDAATKSSLRALLTSAAPWSRRRPVALACYGVDWEWEA